MNEVKLAIKVLMRRADIYTIYCITNLLFRIKRKDVFFNQEYLETKSD